MKENKLSLQVNSGLQLFMRTEETSVQDLLRFGRMDGPEAEGRNLQITHDVLSAMKEVVDELLDAVEFQQSIIAETEKRRG